MKFRVHVDGAWPGEAVESKRSDRFALDEAVVEFLHRAIAGSTAWDAYDGTRFIVHPIDDEARALGGWTHEAGETFCVMIAHAWSIPLVGSSHCAQRWWTMSLQDDRHSSAEERLIAREEVGDEVFYVCTGQTEVTMKWSSVAVIELLDTMISIVAHNGFRTTRHYPVGEGFSDDPILIESRRRAKEDYQEMVRLWRASK